LLRLLCAECKRAHDPTDEELRESGLNPERHRGNPFYESVGCEVCHFTGYRGRTTIHELLSLSDNIRELILDRRPGSEIRRVAVAEGLGSLRESALRKVFRGVSTLREINRVTFVEPYEG
jgi:type IV pilus assembly protein PilB